MAKQFPDVSWRYGAPMGRRDYRGDPDAPYRFRVFRVRLDAGGYDDGGAYWGTGQPLYCAVAVDIWDKCDGVDYAEACHFMRANDRQDVKAWIIEQYPNARFFR